jgi:large subunit ribosomal protein L6
VLGIVLSIIKTILYLLNTLSVKAGYSNLININIPESVDVLFLSNTEIIVKSFNYDLLKLFCLNLKRVRIPDSYKGKGVRFFNDISSLKNIKKNV